MKKVLILVHPTISQMAYESILKENGYSVFTCHSINEAIYTVMNQKIDLIIATDHINEQSCLLFFKFVKGIKLDTKILLSDVVKNQSALPTSLIDGFISTGLLEKMDSFISSLFDEASYSKVSVA